MTDNGEIVWEEPPSTGGRPQIGIWERRLAGVMERPGDWARVFTGALDSARQHLSNLNRGGLRVPAGNWEFTSRKLDDGTGAVYARYLGPEDSE